MLLCLFGAPSANAQKNKKAKEKAEPTAEFSLPSSETMEQKLERMKWCTGGYIHCQPDTNG